MVTGRFPPQALNGLLLPLDLCLGLDQRNRYTLPKLYPSLVKIEA